MRKIVSLVLLLALCVSRLPVFSVPSQAAEESHIPTPFAMSNAAFQSEPISMSGYTYNDAIKFTMGYTGLSTGKRGQVTYNLKGRYEKLTFEAGYLGGTKRNATLHVFADGA